MSDTMTTMIPIDDLIAAFWDRRRMYRAMSGRQPLGDLDPVAREGQEALSRGRARLARLLSAGLVERKGRLPINAAIVLLLDTDGQPYTHDERSPDPAGLARLETYRARRFGFEAIEAMEAAERRKAVV